MSLHDEIMRIPCDPKRSPCRGVSAELAYKSGHRDARHTAAELAAAAEQPDTVPVPRELLERVLSGKECAKAANELRAILGKETV